MRALLAPHRERLVGLRRGAQLPQISRLLLLLRQPAPHQDRVPVQLHLRPLRQVLRLRVRLSAHPSSVPRSERPLAWTTTPSRRP